jgi:dienelactone hydrolase
MTVERAAAAGALPRRAKHPAETHAGLDTELGTLVTRDGTRLRTITTRPKGATGRLPAILFLQWLSCDSVELPESANDGWARMLKRVARESGAVMMRTDKRGVGDSEGGPCAELDYLTELSDHRDAFEKLAGQQGVDPDRIVVFGASMGGNFAPLVALERKVAGVVVWGGGARTWFERMLAFERNRRELSGVPGERLGREMKDVSLYLSRYLLEGRTPREIAATDPALGEVWSRLLGTAEATHYGRPVAFHQQAQQQEWASAWSRLDAPALALFGEYDWYEDAAGHQLIAALVARRHPRGTRFTIVPQTDHHFVRYARREDAVTETGGTIDEGPVVTEILRWLRELWAA